jgi:hypothetical protein
MQHGRTLRVGRLERSTRRIVDTVHEDLHRQVALGTAVRPVEMEQQNVVLVLVSEPKGSAGQELVEPLDVVVEAGRLAVGIDFVLALVDEELDLLASDAPEELDHGLGQRRAAAGNHDHLVVEDEQTRLGKQVGVAGLARDRGQDPRPAACGDARPVLVPETAKRWKRFVDHELDLLLGSLEESCFRLLRSDRVLHVVFGAPCVSRRARF